jgi:anti-anti-sigma factor
MTHTAPVIQRTRPSPRGTTVRLGGDVDRASTVRLGAMLDAHCASTEGDVTIDCEHLELIDSVGAAMLFHVRRTLDASGRALHLDHVPDGACRRLLATHGLHSVIRSERPAQASAIARSSSAPM